MAVLAIFTYEVVPGRMADFLAKLATAASPRFNSPVMPKGARLYRNTVPGPDTGPVLLVIEYEDMAAYGAQTAWENGNPDWRALSRPRRFSGMPDLGATPHRVHTVTNMRWR